MIKTLTLLFSLLVLQANAQETQPRKKFRVGLNADYIMPTSKIKSEISPLIFFNSGQTVGLDLAFIPKKGRGHLKIAVDYLTGKNDNTQIAVYAKKNDISFSSYQFTSQNPSGYRLQAGTKFMIFSNLKKLPLVWLDLKAGVFMGNNQNVEFISNGKRTLLLNEESSKVNFVYNPSLVVNIVKTKKMHLNLRAGYSNLGGISLGLNLTSSCCLNDCCCSKCGPCCK
jgi:hypothetical protein